MASVARCSIQGCHEHAIDLCSRCSHTVCTTHSTINEVCFECVLGMNSATGEATEALGPAYIWWTE